MRQHLLTSIIVALTALALGACADETTAPSTAPTTGGPELAVAPNTWIIRRDMWNTERSDFVTATVPNAAGQSVVYVIGGRGASGVGLTSVMAYNVTTNSWTLRAPLPVPLYGMSGAGVINGKIYVPGGFSYWYPQRGMLMYDPVKNTWAVKSPIPYIRYDAGASIFGAGSGVSGVINGKLYVLTQCWDTSDQQYRPCDEALLFRYNPITDRWARLASPPQDAGVFLQHGMAGVIGGKLYVVGGTGTEGRITVYDPATNQWTAKRGLGLPRADAASVVHAGKLYLIGGTRFNADETSEVLRANIAYDPITDRWTNYAPLPGARTGLAGSLVTPNGQPRIEVIGGSRPGNNLQFIP